MSKLETGVPLTYAWLNELYEQVQDLKDAVDLKNNKSKITMIADHMSASTNVQILTGALNVSIGKGDNTGKSLESFTTPFADPDVLVVPAINFPSNRENFYATVIVDSIKETGCVFKVKAIGSPDKKKTTSVLINYIAIGKSKI